MVSHKRRRGLLLVMMDVDTADEDELNRWYDEEHLIERADCPGFLSARRFVAIEGSPKYLALYDLESPDVLESEAYLRMRHGSAWTRALEPRFKNFKRNVYVEITPDLAGLAQRGARRKKVAARRSGKTVVRTRAKKARRR